MLIVPYHRLGQRILRAKRQRVCGDRTAAIRKSGDRRSEILEISIAAENLIATGEAMIQSYVELVLIVGFVGNTSVIVGLRAAGREGIVGQQAGCYRIKRVNRNDISRISQVV